MQQSLLRRSGRFFQVYVSLGLSALTMPAWKMVFYERNGLILESLQIFSISSQSPDASVADWGPWLDTLPMYKKYYPGLDSYNLEQLINNFHLGELLKRLGQRYCPPEEIIIIAPYLMHWLQPFSCKKSCANLIQINVQ